MKANQAHFPVRTLCRVLQASSSGYNDWLDRPASARAQANALLLERIAQMQMASDAPYGVPLIHAEPVDEGLTVGRQRGELGVRADQPARAGELYPNTPVNLHLDRGLVQPAPPPQR